MFKFGCWATFATAVVQLASHLAGPQGPATDTERQLMELAGTYRFALPGGTERTFMDLVDGLSLLFALLLATLGGVGLIVQKRARHDATLMVAVARMLALSALVMLGISLTKFFIVPTLFIAVIAVCFLVASVESPGT